MNIEYVDDVHWIYWPGSNRGLWLSNMNSVAIDIALVFEVMKMEDSVIGKGKVRHDVDPRTVSEWLLMETKNH